ncbi:hypothetical protein Salat_1848200 [Sesamum alatum]|uniref:Uncharacterized protein n=1 Tax=Sesamum alatum TaxID=300844 RepID=A0AAE2CHU6_9LAMI|nr:hypothetical protein Salat_1848200 [Sesamum alatum]
MRSHHLNHGWFEADIHKLNRKGTGRWRARGRTRRRRRRGKVTARRLDVKRSSRGRLRTRGRQRIRRNILQQEMTNDRPIHHDLCKKALQSRRSKQKEKHQRRQKETYKGENNGSEGQSKYLRRDGPPPLSKVFFHQGLRFKAMAEKTRTCNPLLHRI